MDAELRLVNTGVGEAVLENVLETYLTLIVDNVIFDVGSPHLL
jgi:hypothetical protein